MSRPALSAARSTRILDLLGFFPERRFSLTEIARATEVNVASCLAILGELVQRGYLCRHVTHKSYWLGPALISGGAAAMIANPMLARARAMAEQLREELGLPVLLSTRIDAEITCVFSLSDHAGRTAGLRAGNRVPLVPPIGTSFLAWSPPSEAEAWIARRAGAGAEQVAHRLRETLALIRARGFHVTLRLPERDDITSVIARASLSRGSDYDWQMSAYVEALDVDAAQPDTRDTNATYNIHLIAAPLVDPDTRAVYNLCLGGFSDLVSGTMIAELGRRLIAGCLEIMKGTA